MSVPDGWQLAVAALPATLPSLDSPPEARCHCSTQSGVVAGGNRPDYHRAPSGLDPTGHLLHVSKHQSTVKVITV